MAYCDCCGTIFDLENITIISTLCCGCYYTFEKNIKTKHKHVNCFMKNQCETNTLKLHCHKKCNIRIITDDHNTEKIGIFDWDNFLLNDIKIGC